MNILHISDLHFSNNRLDEKRRCFSEILCAAATWRPSCPDIAVVAGDTFDHSVRMEDKAAEVAVQVFSELAEICPILFIKGNYSHDRNSVEILRYVKGTFPIHVSTDPEVVWFGGGMFGGQTLEKAAQVKSSVNGLKTVFATLPYPSSSFLAQRASMGPEALRVAISEAITDVIRGFSAVQSFGVPKILIFHGTVKGSLITESQHTMGMDIELTKGDIEACGFDLVCAGHLHYSQRIGDRIFYPGGLSFITYGDEGKKGGWMHNLELDDTKKWNLNSEFISVTAIPMRTWDIDLTEGFRSGPWLEPPEWGNEVCDVKVRAKVREDEPRALGTIDFKAALPNARSIVFQRIVEPVKSVRCESVRQAKTLVEKLDSYCEFAGMKVEQSLLDKAALLEGADEAEIIKRATEKAG